MDSLKKYIMSSFNLWFGCDAKQMHETAKMCILEPRVYKVFVSNIKFPNAARKTITYFNLLEKALKEWEKATNNLVRFQITDTLYDADIDIDWVKQSKKYAGYHYIDVALGKRKHFIKIGILKDFNLVSDNSVYHLLLHELGHAMGLGHSPNDDDVMSKEGNWVQELSPNDLFVTRLLYSLPKDSSYLSQKDYINKEITKFLSKTETVEEKNLFEDLDNIAYINKYRLHTRFYFAQLAEPMYAKVALY